MSPRPSLWLALIPLLLASPVRAQGVDAQSRFWNGAMQGDTVAMAQALREGAMIDSLDTRRNRNGRRALNWAAWYNHVPAIDFLLAHGAPLKARNRTGFTALHHAAEAGSLAAARALLAAGADRNTVNEAGRKPVETARLEGHEEMARLLQEAAD
ncbi:MAG: ankyrin repeat domain-containing protein [Gemmatimonadales bacterium]